MLKPKSMALRSRNLTPEQMPDVSGFPHVTQELLNLGYSTGDIKKILGENFIRVLNEAEK